MILFSVMLVPVQSAIAATFPDFTELVENVQPSIVSIKVDIKQRGRTIGKAGGSGFIIDDEGYILTNHHVIDNSDKVSVKLSNGREYEAKIIGSDAGSDVALLKITPKNVDLKPIKLGNSTNLKVGEWVLAFGAPFNLEQTVTAGIVSAKGRGGVGSQFVPFIQTDVAINRGNSGGPLVNLKGEVVGINSMVFNPMISSGLSFSIPIDLADSVSKQLQETGKVVRGYLGVGYEAVDQDVADYLELPEVNGALINNVAKDSPADEAGIKPRDVIVEIEGNKIKQHQDLPFYIAQIAPGTKVEIKAYRDGKLKTFETTLVSREGSLSVNQQNSDDNILGLEVLPLENSIKERLGINFGVLVNSVEPGSPAQRAGIEQGDIILEIDRVAIATLDQFNRQVAKLENARKALVLISRAGVGSDYLVLDLR